MNLQQWNNTGSNPSVAAARRTVRGAVGCLLGAALALGGCGQKGALKAAPSPAASGASAAVPR